MGIAEASQGAPTVAEYAVAEFAAGIGLSTEAGKAYLGEALELRYRLPRTWQRVVGGDLPGWKARLVARETTRLSARRRVKPRQVVLNVHLSDAAVGEQRSRSRGWSAATPWSPPTRSAPGAATPTPRSW